MILHTANLGCFTVHFQHEVSSDTPRETRCFFHPARKEKCHGNLCDVSDALHGTAHCAPNDMFDKSRGRKIALGRAISQLPRGTRTEIWNSYFQVIGHF